jgi:hypothetical protein
MTTDDIIYCEGFPEEVRAAVHPLLSKYVGLVPAYVRKLWVAFDEKAEADSSVASQNGKWEYGFSKVWIRSNWLKCTPHDREETIVHELVHCVLMPLAHAAEELIIDTMTEDSPAANLAHRSLAKALEMTTQGLAESFYHMVKRGVV